MIAPPRNPYVYIARWEALLIAHALVTAGVNPALSSTRQFT
jgi:hypothetical protein